MIYCHSNFSTNRHVYYYLCVCVCACVCVCVCVGASIENPQHMSLSRVKKAKKKCNFRLSNGGKIDYEYVQYLSVLIQIYFFLSFFSTI